MCRWPPPRAAGVLGCCCRCSCVYRTGEAPSPSKTKKERSCMRRCMGNGLCACVCVCGSMGCRMQSGTRTADLSESKKKPRRARGDLPEFADRVEAGTALSARTRTHAQEHGCLLRARVSTVLPLSKAPQPGTEYRSGCGRRKEAWCAALMRRGGLYGCATSALRKSLYPKDCMKKREARRPAGKCACVYECACVYACDCVYVLCGAERGGV